MFYFFKLYDRRIDVHYGVFSNLCYLSAALLKNTPFLEIENESLVNPLFKIYMCIYIIKPLLTAW